MDPELSFLQANLAQANHNSIILDPFCGTGWNLNPRINPFLFPPYTKILRWSSISGCLFWKSCAGCRNSGDLYENAQHKHKNKNMYFMGLKLLYIHIW